MDYRKSKAPVNTVTRNIMELCKDTGNIYESVVIIGKRANQIAVEIKADLSKKLQEFATLNDKLEAIHRTGIPVFVLYESPHRIVDLVTAIAEKWPDCLLCVCSDLTKRYERLYRGNAPRVLEQLRANPGVEKGEYCLAVDISMLSPTHSQAEMPPAEAWMLSKMLDGADLAQAARQAQDAGYARNEVYRAKLRIADMFDEE